MKDRMKSKEKYDDNNQLQFMTWSITDLPASCVNHFFSRLLIRFSYHHALIS